MTDIMLSSPPSDWKIVRLGQLFRERKTKVSDKDFQPLSVTKHGVVPQLDTAAKTDDGDNRKLVRVGDFVINSRSDRKGSGGLSELDGSVSLINIVLEPMRIEPRFAHHLLRSSAFQEEFYRCGHGIVADLWTTRFFDMKNIRLALPDRQTQCAIADFLDRETARIDLLIAAKQRMVETLLERTNSHIVELFDRAVDSSTPRAALRYFVRDLCDGPFGSSLTSAHYVEEGVRVIRLQNIKSRRFDGRDAAFISDDHYRTLGDHGVIEGDLLVAGLGDPNNLLGRACLAPPQLGPAMVKADCFRVRLDQRLLTHRYVAHYLSSPLGAATISMLAKGVTRARVNLQLLKSVTIPMLSIEEQNRLVEEIETSINRDAAIISSTQRSIHLLQERRSALATATITGGKSSIIGEIAA